MTSQKLFCVFEIVYAISALAVCFWVMMFGPWWGWMAMCAFFGCVIAIQEYRERHKPLTGADRLTALHLHHEYQPDNADWRPRSLH
jgi:hypothetical protein